MPRRTRKELLFEDEELVRRTREEAYRRLDIQLHRAWHETCSNDATQEVEAYRSVLLNVRNG